MQVVAKDARLAGLPDGAAPSRALGAGERRDAARRCLERAKARVLEGMAKGVVNLVVVGGVLDGALPLRLRRDLLGLEGRLPPPQLAVAILLAVDRDGILAPPLGTF